MHILSESFFVLSCIGIWRPVSWISRRRVILYGAYNIFSLMSIYSLGVGQFIHVCKNLNDMDEVINTTWMMLSVVNDIFKSTTFFIYRNNIIELSERLFKYPMKSENGEEGAIELKFNNYARKICILFVGSITVLLCTFTVQSFFLFNDGNLLTPCWYPYDNSKAHFLAISWIHQFLCYIIGGFIAGCCDTIFAGFLINACSQLEILKLRFYQMGQVPENDESNEDHLRVRERKYFLTCIEHHNSIFKYAKDLNGVFYPVLLGQFFSSILLICSSVQSLSNTKLSPEIAPMALYLAIVFAEIFFYCWFGNEVMLNSLDLRNAIFSTDWKRLSLRGQKDLLFILLRTKTPIKITSSFLVILSNDSFVTILKASYSIFNLMRNANA